MTSFSILGGTGDLGSGLAVRLAKAGHEIHIGSRDAEKARNFVAGVLAEHPGQALNMTGHDLPTAAAAAEICVLTVPYAAHASTLEQIKARVSGKIVIDTTVPLRPPKVGTVQLPEAGSAAVETQLALGPEARVVSALQNIGAEKLASGQAVDGDVLVASDNAEAAQVVCGILESIGLRSWHVGPLANSAAAEAMTSILIQINRRYKRVQAGLRITGKPKEQDEDHSRSYGVQIHPLNGLPMFGAGDDLAGAIAESIGRAGLAPQDGDVIVVAQKAVSKVEGRAVALAEVKVSDKARELASQTGKPEAVIELITGESAEVMRVREGLIITRHKLGTVMANSGVDTSNVGDPAGPDTVLLWPKDPDVSAAKLRKALEAKFGARLAVIVSDSLGRAWRVGTAGTAIGVAGMKPLRDRRGETDLFGRVLQATVVAVADEIASAASLVIGEAAEGVPAALVRGAVYDAVDEGGVGDLLRPIEEDLFR